MSHFYPRRVAGLAVLLSLLIGLFTFVYVLPVYHLSSFLGLLISLGAGFVSLVILRGFAGLYFRSSRTREIPAQGKDRPANQSPSQNYEVLASLRRNLRLKVMYDEAKIDRLIDFERRKNPNAREVELMQAAIDRWERDNR